MKQWYTPLIVTAYSCGMIYATSYYYALPLLVIGMLGYSTWWWKQSMGKESENVKPLLGGIWLLIIAMPLIGYTFEYWWMQLQIAVVSSLLLSLFFYYTLQLKGDFRARPPAYRKLLQVSIMVVLLAIGMPLALIGIVSIQTIGMWIIAASITHAAIVYWYISALRIPKELRLASVLVQVIVALPFWWIMNMLPFAPLTKSLLVLAPVLYLLGVERDRLLQEIDMKQAGLQAVYIILLLIVLLTTTRWS